MIGVILAGGKSTRFNSDKSKVVHSINGKEMIVYVVEAMIPFVDEIIVVVGQNIDDVKNSLKDYNVKFVVQKEALGTGHAVLTVENFIPLNEDLIICYGDKPWVKQSTFSKIKDIFIKTNADAIISTSILENPLKKGRIIRENEKFVCIKEFKDASSFEKDIKEVNGGIYCFKSKDLFRLLKKIKNDNAAKEYYLTSLFPLYLKENLKIETVFIEPKEILDVNSLDDLK